MTGEDGQPPLGFSGDVLRLLVGSALTILLLTGGVYWLHHVPTGSPQRDAGTAVQVRLLPTEEPTPFPLAVGATSPTAIAADDADATSTEPSETRQERDTHVASITPPRVGRPAATTSRLTQRSARTPASELTLRFQQALLRHISRFQQYPQQARGHGMEGTVLVVFLLRRDGSVMDAWVQSTSGETLLDREALATIRRAEPLPAIPRELPDQIRVLLPVDFTLP